MIFCGKGSSLSPFSSVKDTGTSKALLPVANRPMIEYVLEWCDQAPFKTVTVVCGTDALAGIGKVVDTYKEKRGVNCFESVISTLHRNLQSEASIIS